MSASEPVASTSSLPLLDKWSNKFSTMLGVGLSEEQKLALACEKCDKWKKELHETSPLLLYSVYLSFSCSLARRPDHTLHATTPRPALARFEARQDPVRALRR